MYIYSYISISYTSFLVGNGAHIWAHEMGIQTLPPEQLISSMHNLYKKSLLDFSKFISEKFVSCVSSAVCQCISYLIYLICTI